jgi:two-component system, cell cycle sensor histidine kinase and response regulator CckA
VGSYPPKNEVDRLEALKSFGVLDTPRERAFDDLTRLTSFICGTPMAFIGFLDADRLWFKSRRGWDVSEVPREISFCTHTILQPGVFVISDTLADEDRFARSPLTTHVGIRFYAGVPLVSSDGYAVGVLSAMGWVPRALAPAQTEALQTISRQVMALLEVRRNKAGRMLPMIAAESQNQSKPSPHHQRLEAIRHSEQRLQSIVSSAMDAIITVGNDQKILVFNKAAERIFGCEAGDALGKPIEKFIPERFRTLHREHIASFASTGVTARSMYSPGALFAVRADGEEFPIEATISQVECDGEKLFTVILRDISVRLRMETELRQAQKVEAIGQLAGGIAHEFNNFLGVILGYAELLAEEAGANEKLAQYGSEIISATQHAGSLTRQLLAFSRRQVLQTQTLDVNQCIWEAHNLLQRLVPANIEFALSLDSKTGYVKIDRGQLQQILINLVVNARDAMPQGGRVVIGTENTELRKPPSGQHIDLQAGGYVQLSVSDTGSGMSAETKSHIFEPFYTTKGPDKGTGLGLSTVYGIIKNADGQVHVESEPGKGTTLLIYLPRVECPVNEGQISRPAEPVPVSAGPATILVVEDEASLRRLICSSLEKQGHTVFTAKDGYDALRIFQQQPERIGLVVSDLMMPRMDGLQVRKEILALRSDVRFLFMSGYAEHVVEQQRRTLDGCAFLEKPFLPRELADTVARVLAGDIAA